MKLSALTAGRPPHAIDPPDAEPTPLPPAPEYLGTRQRAVWTRLAAAIDPLQIATERDLDAFALLVDALAVCEEAREALATGGLTYTVGTRYGEVVRRRPEFDVMQTAHKLALVHMSRFGLTPADRRRVSQLAGAPEGQDPIAEFCGGRGRARARGAASGTDTDDS